MDLKRWRLNVLIVLSVVLIFAGISVGADDSPAESGLKVYTQKCQICHGIKGQGNGIAGSSFNPPPTDFSDAGFWKKTTHEQMAQTIRNGKGGMPAFDLPSDEINGVIAYIEQNFKK